MSRQLLIGILVLIFSSPTLILVEIILTQVPQRVLQVTAWLCFIAGLTVIALTDTVYPYIQSYPIPGVALIMFLAALAWYVFIHRGWPFSLLRIDKPSKEKTEDEKHQALIEQWRRMVTVAGRKYNSGKEPGVSFAAILQRQPEYLSLSPLLTTDALRALEVNKPSDPLVPIQAVMAKEIARIETRLNLFPNLLSEADGEPSPPSLTASIQGEIREVFYQKSVSMDSSFVLSADVYYDYVFTLRVYIANRGAPTTIERFGLVLKSADVEFPGEKLLVDNYFVLRPGVKQEPLVDIEKDNDVALEHTRNGWLRFLVRNIKAVGDYHDEPQQQITLGVIDKYKNPHYLTSPPQSEWKKRSWFDPERIAHVKDVY